MTESEIKQILNVMYTKEGQSNVKEKVNIQENTYSIYKTIFKEWILKKNINKTSFNLKLECAVNLDSFEFDVDCLLEEEDNIYIIQNVSTTIKSFCKKMNLLPTDYSIVNEEGIEYHIVYYYVGEFDLIDNTYIHHYNRDREYLDTLKITLSGEDKELLQLMCNNYKEIRL